jgi:hypothetical protein
VLLGDEIGYRPKRSKLLVGCAGLLGLGRLSDEPACAQVGERVSFVHGRKSGDPPATHRYDHLAALSGVVYISAQLVV